MLQFASQKSLLRLALTFGDAERVVAAGHKVVECHKQVAVILAGSGQQVLLGVPAGRFGQTLSLGVGFLKSFCEDREKRWGRGRDLSNQKCCRTNLTNKVPQPAHTAKEVFDFSRSFPCHFPSRFCSSHDLFDQSEPFWRM